MDGWMDGWGLAAQQWIIASHCEEWMAQYGKPNAVQTAQLTQAYRPPGASEE
ncbi:hypothetical protein MAPG_03128 [Magnaporthiopsis poae ATCC 64411]|uniref:Uncharacterized protein n=1 Tax=Magnaporthiopsis poae (strain ATCC 64411 / 73-15) TaxID=644358 RepID=A0A0C4DT69_MAGP6|nr:hypothetical protein MAPG_03128 [Magnaporthiopsis poae ATCC 64411]